MSYGIDQVLVSTGAKHSLYNLFVALLDMSGDTVVLPNLAAGVWHQINFKRVRSTSTTAADIFGGHI